MANFIPPANGASLGSLYKCHSAPSLYSCVFIGDNLTTVDTETDQEPSIYEWVDGWM